MSNTYHCLMIDNFDSFTYNVVHYLEMLNVRVTVIRNDQPIKKNLEQLKPNFLVISPGPSHPKDSPGALEAIDNAVKDSIPLLGICLGHQCIAHYFGGDVSQAPIPVHGKPAEVFHDNDKLFVGIPSPFKVGRYHSLVVNQKTLPTSLKVTSKLSDGLIMSIEHQSLAIAGVQFHPESIISEHGHTLFRNFITGYVND